MNIEDMLGTMLTGALGGRRKRSRRTHGYLARRAGSSLLNPTTLIGVAGVAWGAWEAFQRKNAGAAGGTGGPVPPSSAGGFPGAGSGPGGASPPGVPPEVDRLVRLAISAARADGTLSDVERATILDHSRRAGLEPLAASELERPAPLAQLVAGITDPAQKEEAYALAFAIVRADEDVSGAERIFLAQLAAHLGLPLEQTRTIEERTAAGIDAEPTQEARS